MENIIWVVLLCAVLALLFAAWKTSVVSKADAGTERMKEIAGNISDGARAFLFAEYKILVIFVAVLFVLIGLFITWLTAVCFLIGAVFSVCAGYVGMNVATKANVRTAAAAKSSGMNKALGVAVSDRSVMASMTGRLPRPRSGRRNSLHSTSRAIFISSFRIRVSPPMRACLSTK